MARAASHLVLGIVWYVLCSLAASAEVLPSYNFTTFSGPAGGPGRADGPASLARFNSPAAVAVDTQGRVLVADYGNNVIRRIATNGVVSTLAGQAGNPGSADGPGATAQFNGPASVAVDLNGNVYVADTGNNAVRKIAVDGVVSTLAGNATNVGHADGPGLTAQFRAPAGVAIDPAGGILVSDYGNNTIRRIAPDGVVSTLAGVPGFGGAADGPAASATFRHPTGLAVDTNGVIYIADTDNSLIRVIQTNGVVTTLAGNAGVAGYLDGRGAGALFNYPQGVAVGQYGMLYVADAGNHVIRLIDSYDDVTVAVGAVGNPGYTNASYGAARFSAPVGVAFGASGNIYVADQENHAIRQFVLNGVVQTLAGAPGGESGFADGPASRAAFNAPRQLAVDPAGNVYVADDGNRAIRLLDAQGTALTRADVSLWLTSVISTALDPQGNLYAGGEAASVFSVGLHNGNGVGGMVLKAPPFEVPGPFAGGRSSFYSGQAPVSADGIGTNAAIGAPSSLLSVAGGGILFVDTVIDSVRQVSAGGEVTTFAGVSDHEPWSLPGRYGGSAMSNGPAATARFAYPSGLAQGPDGSFYVGDTENHAIRRITPDGTVSTVAGFVGPYTNAVTANLSAAPGYVDGPVSAAQFFLPTAVAVGMTGIIFVADQRATVVRAITPDGMVTTVAGVAGLRAVADGLGVAAQFRSISSLALDAAGNLYVADAGNHRIVKGAPAPPPALSARRSGSDIQLTLTSVWAGNFAIEYATTLNAGTVWQPVSGAPAAWVGTGATTWTDSAVTDLTRFYRAVQVP